MSHTRRRRLAWLFALVLLAELALVCCASVHVSSHACAGHDCAICDALRPQRRLRIVPRATALTVLAALPLIARRLRRFARCGDTQVSLRTRLND